MKIDDVEVGARITIEVIQGSEKLQFESKAVRGIPLGLLIESIQYDDKVVGFDTLLPIMYNVYTEHIETKQVQVWKMVQIKAVLSEGTRYHLVMTKDDSTIVNRRETFRIYVGLQGVAQLGSHRSAYEVVIKDISMTGIAVVSKDNIDISESGISRIIFTDHKLDVKLDLRAVVVRQVQLAGGLYLYGCALVGEYQDLAGYISQKQRELLRKKSYTKSKNTKKGEI